MYFARLSQSDFNNFHVPENLAIAHADLYELSDCSLKFVAEGKFNTDLFNHCDLTSETAPTQQSENPQLVMLSEGLNLEKLYQIQSALRENLEVKLWKIRPRATGIGVVVKARVQLLEQSLHEQSSLNECIDEIAKKFRVELALLESPPKLSAGGLMLMDMDSTLIAVECIDEIAKLAGMGDKVASITERAMQGKLDFAESLHSRVECLAGVEVSLLQGIRDRLPLMPGVSKLISYMQRNSWKVVIVSGGFTYFADYLKERLDMYDAISNTLEVKNGRLTGKVLGDVVDANVKAQTLLNMATKLKVVKAQTIAVGDGANDLVMMSKASLGVAYHAKPIVREQATAAIRFGGLDTLLDFLD